MLTKSFQEVAAAMQAAAHPAGAMTPTPPPHDKEKMPNPVLLVYTGCRCETVSGSPLRITHREWAVSKCGVALFRVRNVSGTVIL